jgi:hypothetical protein
VFIIALLTAVGMDNPCRRSRQDTSAACLRAALRMARKAVGDCAWLSSSALSALANDFA